MFSGDCSPFLDLFHKLHGISFCQHPQSFFTYHPSMYMLVKSQSMGKGESSSSLMHHQGIKLFLSSCTDILTVSGFVLRLDSSWSQNSCRSSNDHILTWQCPKFASGVKGSLSSLYPFLKVRMFPKAASLLINHNCACAHFHDNSS